MEISKEERNQLINPRSIIMAPLKIKFNISVLDSVLAFICKESTLRTRKTLSNFYKLFSNLDMRLYEDSPELSERIWVIKTILYAKINEKFDSLDSISDYVIDQLECSDYAKEIVENIPNLKISYEESKYLIKKLDDTLEYGYTVTVKDIIKRIIDSIDDGDFKSYKNVQHDLYDIATSVINIKRNISSLGSDQTFSLQDEIFDIVIDEAVQKLKDRNRTFITGIRDWNAILSPGYMSKRLYIYLAFPGKGKSTILLKSAIDIRRYNPDIVTKDPDKRPAVLFLTLENDISETIERLFNMTTDIDDIRNYTPRQVKKKMQEDGYLKLTKENNIDIIIKEYKNREIDTNDIYSIINDLSDEGIEVITLIVDYIKRIRPAERANDEKTELKNISNELKELAKFFDIPVITAQQLNRAGAAVIDAALQANKEDVTRLVGRDAIAGSWEILENADWTCIINPETKTDTGDLYLTFKLLKRRYRSTEPDEKLRRLDYFNHPFEVGSEIRLIDDYYLPKSVSLTSIATPFEPVENSNKGKHNAMQRTEIGMKKQSKGNTVDDIGIFEPFSDAVSTNF